LYAYGVKSVTRDTKLPRDDEEYRRIAIYEASSAKEHAAAVQLLYPSPNLSHRAYMKLVGDLQAIRKDCNEQMLPVILMEVLGSVGEGWAGEN
jgi:hypothetical protein